MLVGIAGLNPAGPMDVLSVVTAACCQVEVSATDRSLVQRSPINCGASECDREASIMRTPWPTRGCYSIKKKDTTEMESVRCNTVEKWNIISE